MKRKEIIFLVSTLIVFLFIKEGISQSQKDSKTKEEQTTPQLIQELNSEETKIRSNAAEQLGNRKVKEAVPHLIKALKDKDFTVRRYAAKALGRIEDIRAVTALIEVLKNNQENWSVKKEAAEALVNISDSAAFLPLIDTLKYECEIERKKNDLYPPPKHGYISADEYIEKEFLEQIENFIKKSQEEKYIDLLLKHIHDNKAPKVFRYQLAIILGGMERQEVIPVLIECLKKSSRGYLRAQAAFLLGKMKVQEAIPALELALKDQYLDNGSTVSKKVGEQMIENYNKTDGKEIFSAIKIEKEDDHYRVRAYAVRNAAAAALRAIGLKIIKVGYEYKIIK